MEFKSYPSIENTTHKKTLDYELQHHPEVRNYKWILREKIDGCNIQFLFQPSKLMMVGKRTSFFLLGDSFYDIWSTIERYESELTKIQQYCDSKARKFVFMVNFMAQESKAVYIMGPSSEFLYLTAISTTFP